MRTRETVDYLVVGGGFYGCCLALFLRSISHRVMLVEARNTLLDRSSRVNQARIHTGFHYPRSALTAVKSMVLHQCFARDFPEATVDDFQMLYGVARQRSKVSAKRFFRMFRDMKAPIGPASVQQAALFDPDMIDEVFVCREAAFDYLALRELMQTRTEHADLDVRLGTAVHSICDGSKGAVVTLSQGTEIEARFVFNVTYAELNTVLSSAKLPSAPLKYELAEIALVKPPELLKDIGVTVMDGPFFSMMPYPGANTHSLTHVRYTPHQSWTLETVPCDIQTLLKQATDTSRFRHMFMDSKRYLPSLEGLKYEKSIYEVKTVLSKNEADDGRPILFQRKPNNSRVISILGGKIDNIYDLFVLLRQAEPEFSSAETSFLLGKV